VQSGNGKAKGYIHKGYRLRYVASRKKWVPEHRLVVEEASGRLLRRDEHVHHINGDRLDKRLENLEVIDQPKHSREHKFILRELSRSRRENEELRKQIAELTNQIGQLS